MDKIAKELVKLARELVAYDNPNYEIIQMIVDSLSETWWIDNVGASDGSHDDTLFSLHLKLKPTYLESDGRGSRYIYPAGFEIPLRKLTGLIRNVLRLPKFKIEGVDEHGREFTAHPEMVGKVLVPRQKRFRRRYDDDLIVYENDRAEFEVIIHRNYKRG